MSRESIKIAYIPDLRALLVPELQAIFDVRLLEIERAAAEKVKAACADEAAWGAKQWTQMIGPGISAEDKETFEDRAWVSDKIAKAIRAIDVDAVLKDSPPPATPGGTAPHQERGT